MPTMNHLQRKLRTFKCLIRSKSFAPLDMRRVHIILADSRSGSTFFQEHLNCHPDNTEFVEVFSKRRLIMKISDNYQYFPINYLSHLLLTSKTKQMGCKITFTQLIRNVDCIKFLKKYKYAKFIVLERENTVASAVSLIIAKKTGKYHTKRKDIIHTKHYIDPIELKMLIDWRTTLKKTILDLIDLLKVNFYKITYEALISQTESTISNVFNYLGLPYTETRSPLKKLNPQKMSNIISNYEAVKNYFKPFKEFYFLD